MKLRNVVVLVRTAAMALTTIPTRKTLNGLTPYELIWQGWLTTRAVALKRLQKPGLNTSLWLISCQDVPIARGLVR